ncbi:hypothetical protein PR048_023063 [Dryococelus australis]|uniref:Transmembrane protein n=1 Tax=Dryococelus australis TaxID=614101 RepID=A0ABQ9GT15_9NEOP|nr:hypothetical protein PR048_023063 [Dryococelus australis]
MAKCAVASLVGHFSVNNASLSRNRFTSPQPSTNSGKSVRGCSCKCAYCLALELSRPASYTTDEHQVTMIATRASLGVIVCISGMARGIIWTALNIEVLREATRMKRGELGQRRNAGAGETEKSPRKPADQPRHPARFPHAKILGQPRRETTRFASLCVACGLLALGLCVYGTGRQTSATCVNTDHLHSVLSFAQTLINQNSLFAASCPSVLPHAQQNWGIASSKLLAVQKLRLFAFDSRASAACSGPACSASHCTFRWMASVSIEHSKMVPVLKFDGLNQSKSCTTKMDSKKLEITNEQRWKRIAATVLSTSVRGCEGVGRMRKGGSERSMFDVTQGNVYRRRSLNTEELLPRPHPHVEAWTIARLFYSGAAVAEMLACSPPTKDGFNTRPGHSRIFTIGNRAGRHRWSAAFLGDIPFTPTLHSGAGSKPPTYLSTVLFLPTQSSCKASCRCCVCHLIGWSTDLPPQLQRWESGGHRLCGPGGFLGVLPPPPPLDLPVRNSLLTDFVTSISSGDVTASGFVGLRETDFHVRAPLRLSGYRKPVAKFNEGSLTSSESCARSGDAALDACVSVVLIAPALLCLKRRKYLQPSKKKKRRNCQEPKCIYSMSIRTLIYYRGSAVAERLVYSPPTKANRVQSPVGPLPDFRKRESCRKMLLVGGFSRGSPVLPAIAFRRCSILTSLHPHRLSRRRT